MSLNNLLYTASTRAVISNNTFVPLAAGVASELSRTEISFNMALSSASTTREFVEDREIYEQLAKLQDVYNQAGCLSRAPLYARVDYLSNSMYTDV